MPYVLPVWSRTIMLFSLSLLATNRRSSWLGRQGGATMGGSSAKRVISRLPRCCKLAKPVSFQRDIGDRSTLVRMKSSRASQYDQWKIKNCKRLVVGKQCQDHPGTAMAKSKQGHGNLLLRRHNPTSCLNLINGSSCTQTYPFGIFSEIWLSLWTG